MDGGRWRVRITQWWWLELGALASFSYSYLSVHVRAPIGGLGAGSSDSVMERSASLTLSKLTLAMS